MRCLAGRILLGITLGASAPALAAVGHSAALMDAGNSLYSQGKYEEAAQQYQQILLAGHSAAAVHYNLANARYKSGQMGEAILHYEKAVRLDPSDTETQLNLEFLRSQIVDRTTPAGAQTASLFMERFLSWTTPEFDAALLAGLWLLVGGLMAVVLVTAGTAISRLRRAAIWGLVSVALPLTAVALVFGVKGWREMTVIEGVVLVERLDVMSGPGEDQTMLFTVHEGLKVRVRLRQGGWARIILENGLNGWIPDTAIGEI